MRTKALTGGDHVMAEGEGNPLQAKTRDLRRNQTSWHFFYLTLVASTTWGKKFLLFNTLSLWKFVFAALANWYRINIISFNHPCKFSRFFPSPEITTDPSWVWICPAQALIHKNIQIYKNIELFNTFYINGLLPISSICFILLFSNTWGLTPCHLRSDFIRMNI